MAIDQKKHRYICGDIIRIQVWNLLANDSLNKLKTEKIK